MNENQSIIKNYILIVKTLHGDPGENITVIIKGNDGQTEKLSLGKSQVEIIIMFIRVDEIFFNNFSHIIKRLKIIKPIFFYLYPILILAKYFKSNFMQISMLNLKNGNIIRFLL